MYCKSNNSPAQRSYPGLSDPERSVYDRCKHKYFKTFKNNSCCEVTTSESHRLSIHPSHPLGSFSTILRPSRACRTFLATFLDPTLKWAGYTPFLWRPPQILIMEPTPTPPRRYRWRAVDAGGTYHIQCSMFQYELVLSFKIQEVDIFQS